MVECDCVMCVCIYACVYLCAHGVGIKSSGFCSSKGLKVEPSCPSGINLSVAEQAATACGEGAFSVKVEKSSRSC